MLYLDTSVLIALLTNEARSKDVETWLMAQPQAELAISDWTVTEVSSALSIKLRTGVIDAAQRTAALARFAELADNAIATLEVIRRNFRTAARLSDRHETGLRGADALHLAIAADNAATVATLDQRMAEAAQALGIGTALI